MTAEVNVNWEKVQGKIVGSAARGLNATLDWTEERAKHYAPVRDAFSKLGQRSRRPSYEVPRGQARTDQNEASMDAFMKIFGKSRRKQRQVTTVEPFNAGSFSGRADTANRQKDTATGRGLIGVHEKAGETRARRHGNATSYSPIFIIGGEHVTGLQSFRRIDTHDGQPVLRQHQGRPTFGLEPQVILRGDKGKPLKATREGRGYAAASADTRLNKRGRYELRYAARPDVEAAELEAEVTGKKSSMRRSAVYRTASGTVTLGGRLRGEIHRTQVIGTTNDISGEVVAPTDYAAAQEFGTMRHRAQPFMRPALYESRPKLKENVKRAIERSFA
jgi:HK97 gp10 family phage protein